MNSKTIFSDFLQELGVKHTVDYSNKQFAAMPFKSLFGFSKLLGQYGIDSEAFQLSDRSEISKLSTPFIAKTAGGLVIVTSIADGTIRYLTQGVPESMPLDEFTKAWCGVVFVAYPDPQKSIEPDYKAHALQEFLVKAKKWVLVAGAALLFLYAFITNGLYQHWSTIGVAIIDIFGLWMTYMLVQKSANIHNSAADAVCGVLQSGGCDDVLATKASKFFGLFGWSEVGFAYFSVSLLTLLLFPEWICYLAACNVCCLPFTFWSIWYQKFRAKAWCTMCVSVQGSLWLLFFCYLGGGWLKDVFPLRIEFFVLGLTYVVVLLGLNQLMPLIERNDD